MGLTCFCTLNGFPIMPGPLDGVVGGQVVMGELGQFNKSSLVLDGASRRSVLAMQPYTLIEIQQDGVGTIGYGYVLNPREQVSTNDDHTITLDLEPLTVECIWRLTRRGWVASNLLSIIAARLGSIVPGWSGLFTDAGTAFDFTVSVTHNNVTVLQAFLDTAKQFSSYARMGIDNTGAPTRVLEMGQFGAQPKVWLVSAKGANAEAVRYNPTTQLVATVDRQPNDVSALVNVCVPFGGGTGDAIVTLERLWRILHDPAYPNYGKQATLFPEYDPAYPIADPVAGTRSVTYDGHYDYPVYDTASYATYGYKEGQFIDSSLTYADNSVANQELTERALYVSTIANFKRFAHPHHLFTCTAPGLTRPTRPGDLIAIEYDRVSADRTGTIIEMAVTDTLRVMSVVRAFNAEDPPVDTYTLSNLGRFDQTDATGQAYTANQMVSLQINQGTSIAPVVIGPVSGNVDHLHPLSVPVRIPAQLFRWQKCSLRVDFQPYRATAMTATNSDATITLSVPHGTHTIAPQAGHSFGGSGISTTTDPIPTLPPHTHYTAVTGLGGNTAPTASDAWIQVGNATLVANRIIGQQRVPTSGAIDVPSTQPTAHPHTVPIQPNVAAQFPTSLTGPLPQHTHPLDQRIPDGLTAPNCDVTINGGPLSPALLLTSGTRNGDGTFAGSFELDDIAQYLQLPGQTVTITITPGTGSGNQYGVGRFTCSATWFGEFGGLASTVKAS